MRKKMIFDEIYEYKKDLKKLSKRYRSLPDDIDVIKKVLKVNPGERPPFSYKIDGLGLETCVIKVKKIACKSLKGKGVNSGLRLVYAYFEKHEDKEEKIVFIELYHKADKPNEDRNRILNSFK